MTDSRDSSKFYAKVMRRSNIFLLCACCAIVRIAIVKIATVLE